MKINVRVLARIATIVGLVIVICGCGSSSSDTGLPILPSDAEDSAGTPDRMFVESGDSIKWPDSVDIASNFRKLSISVDGSASEWTEADRVWEEAGTVGTGSFPSSIDVQQVYMNNDTSFLYMFLQTSPTVQEVFDENATSGHLCDVFIDSDNDASTGCTDVTGFDYGKINGYEFRLWIPLGVQSRNEDLKPFVTYEVQTPDSKGQFGFDAIATSQSLESNALTAHGAEGVELAIPLVTIGLKKGDSVRLLLVEAVDPFDKQSYTEGSFVVQ